MKANISYISYLKTHFTVTKTKIRSLWSINRIVWVSSALKREKKTHKKWCANTDGIYQHTKHEGKSGTEIN